MPSFLPDIAMSAPEPFHQTSFALSLMLVSHLFQIHAANQRERVVISPSAANR